MNCTWEGCTKPATRPQLDRHKQQWANLCEEHDQELDKALSPPFDAKTALRAWIKASGGPKPLAARTMKGATPFLQALANAVKKSKE